MLFATSFPFKMSLLSLPTSLWLKTIEMNNNGISAIKLLGQKVLTYSPDIKRLKYKN